MPFVKGQKRAPTAGRKKGTPNKSTKISEFLVEKNINIFEEIWRVYLSFTDPRDQMHSLLKLLEYIQAKPRPIEEVEEEDNTPVTSENVAELYELAREARKTS